MDRISALNALTASRSDWAARLSVEAVARVNARAVARPMPAGRPDDTDASSAVAGRCNLGVRVALHHRPEILAQMLSHGAIRFVEVERSTLRTLRTNPWCLKMLTKYLP